MRIIYPYNEILPKKKAHDAFIVHECAALADLGWEVTLISGKRSASSPFFQAKRLLEHYHVEPHLRLKLESRSLIRKNNFLNMSWNYPFFSQTQRVIQQQRPDWVFLSVRKQAAYHLQHKIKNVRYLYEVHELIHYPHESQIKRKELELEKRLLSQTDLIAVTTHALKEILLNPPYEIKKPIEIIPLAVLAKALPPPSRRKEQLQVIYVGQLYAGQGLPLLIKALKGLNSTQLTIIGGTKEEIHSLSQLANELQVKQQVTFLGYIPPSELSALLSNADAFVAPFEKSGRMPYVAHTKLFEYAEWGRPIIAPKLPIVEEHFKKGGLLFFEPNDPISLAHCLQKLQDEKMRMRLQQQMTHYSGDFSWHKRALHYAQVLF